MSIHEFLNRNHPLGERVGEVRLLQEREKVRGQVRSGINILAGKFVSEGSDGLKKIGRKLGAEGVLIRPDREAFNKLSEEDRTIAAMNFGAVILGNTVIALEDTIINRQINMPHVKDTLNNALVGTPFVGVQDEVPQPRLLTQDEWGGMIKTVSLDKTFKTFFDNDFRAMPRELREFVRKLSFRDAALQLLPHYELIGKELIDRQTRTS